ncbi:MAG: hypothetical protein PHT12_06305 [Patescibacteria group bacterium]|nr:hypothetical protein [Patescibacteria group bacterium]
MNWLIAVLSFVVMSVALVEPAGATETKLEPTATSSHWQLRRGSTPLVVTSLLAPPLIVLNGFFEHETSHAFMATAVGIKVVEFKPYPHMSDRAGERQLFLGYVGFAGPKPGPGKIIPIAAAPYIKDVAFMAATELVLDNWVKPDSLAAIPLLAFGLLGPTVDLALNTFAPSSTTNDFRVIAEQSGLPLWSLKVAGGAVTALGVWRTVHHARRIFWEQVSDKTSSTTGVQISVVPELAPGHTGLRVIGRF